MLKLAPVLLITLVSPLLQAFDVLPCEGSALQRRLALIQVSKQAEQLLLEKRPLAELCRGDVKAVSPLIQGRLFCGDSEHAVIGYACQFNAKGVEQEKLTPVIEYCSYALNDKQVTCENKAVVTHFEH